MRSVCQVPAACMTAVTNAQTEPRAAHSYPCMALQVYACAGPTSAGGIASPPSPICICNAVSLSGIRPHFEVNAVQVVPAGSSSTSTRLLAVGYDEVCEA